MGCPCEDEKPIYNKDLYMNDLDQEIAKRASAGFNVNQIAAGLMVSKAYVEEVLAPKKRKKTRKIEE